MRKRKQSAIEDTEQAAKCLTEAVAAVYEKFIDEKAAEMEDRMLGSGLKVLSNADFEKPDDPHPELSLKQLLAKITRIDEEIRVLKAMAAHDADPEQPDALIYNPEKEGEEL